MPLNPGTLQPVKPSFPHPLLWFAMRRCGVSIVSVLASVFFLTQSHSLCIE